MHPRLLNHFRRYTLCLVAAWAPGLSGCQAAPGETRYDFDGDGVGDETDCSPEDASVYPGAVDPYGDDIDQDCDGADGVDGDGDGWPAPGPGTSPGEEDCDDSNPAVHPGATEIPDDGTDDNCDGNDFLDGDGDGTRDEDDCEPADPALNNADADGDGSTTCDGDCDDTNPAASALDLDGDGYSTCGGDCDDQRAAAWPGAEEQCNGLDDDCDGAAEAGEVDLDLDGSPLCEGDCDDADPALNVDDADGDGVSTCDGDCDDADAAQSTADLDADGYSTCDGDCDDLRAAARPGADEECNGLDDDCDGFVAVDEADADVDGTPTCLGDCDDAEPAINPDDADGDGVSTCDGDCDDDDVARSTADADLDGFSTCDGDCDDARSDVHPGATEQCNAWDDDCDGTPGPSEVDWDGDGHGACDDCDDADGAVWGIDADGDGFSACTGDCSETNPSAFPGAADPFGDTIDQNCDGTDGADGDGDGSPGNAPEGSPDLDCDDALGTVHPGATELCNALDDDCDGTADEDYDGDGDGYASQATCPGHGDDCDDLDPAIHPGAAEVCDDHLDNDCDGGAGSCGIDGTLDLTDADAVLLGAASNDRAAACLSGAGDVNADGYADVLVASEAGAYLALGPLIGTISLGVAEAWLFSDDAGDYAGQTVSGAGDVDGDGYDDVLIGAAGDDGGGANAGAAYLVSGPVSGDLDLATTGARLQGEQAGDGAGSALSRAGDVNGDGFGDFLVGAWYDDTGGDDAGAAYLLLGPVGGGMSLAEADAKLCGVHADDLAGFVVSGAGDVNGDGYDDVLVGAVSESTGGLSAGAVYLMLGPVEGTIDLADADAMLYGNQAYHWAGRATSGAGDVNGDGYDDILIGADGDDTAAPEAGAIFLVLGPVSGTVDLAEADAILYGTAPNSYAGRSVAGVGDVNDDGYGDLLIGAYQDDESAHDAGAAWLVLGPISGTADLPAVAAKLLGEQADDRAGIWVSGAGDTDADGYDDILVGSPYTRSDRGAAYLLRGGGL